MKQKIKVWITSDKLGTCIWKDMPAFDKSAGIFCTMTEDNFPFKVDNSKHLYKEPTEVYISIEEKKYKKPKRINTIKNIYNIKNITE